MKIRVATMLLVAIVAATTTQQVSARAKVPAACTPAIGKPLQLALCINYANLQCDRSEPRVHKVACNAISRVYFKVTGGQQISDLFRDPTTVAAEVPIAGGTLELRDVAIATFVPGDLNSTRRITLTKTDDAAIRRQIQDQGDLLATSVAEHQVTITISDEPPASDFILLGLRVPDGLILDGATPYAIALTPSESPFDYYEAFEHLVPVVRDRPGWIDVLVPGSAFFEQPSGAFRATVSLIGNDDTAPTPEETLAVAAAASPECLSLLFPLGDYTHISSEFNPSRAHPITGTVRPHKGNDYPAPPGTPVLAAANGTVRTNGFEAGGAGNFITVRHANGGITKYFHLSERSLVPVNARVGAGEMIGKVGSTGGSTNPHLHFEYVAPSHGYRNPEGCLMLQSGTWTGTYEWRCSSDLIGASPLTAQVTLLGHRRWSVTLSYLGVNVPASVGTGNPGADGGVLVGFSVPGTASTAPNVFSGTLHGGFMTGTTLNGDSRSGPIVGCSTNDGKAGIWHLSQ